MGIYSSRFLESAIDGSFNTPDDVGIDLKQVEEDIAGPGGIAAHEPEIDDAVEGVVGDPLEEASMIMFESEYNYNQIMEAIGMYELREASYGREVIYESVDIRGFFDKIKKWLIEMFKKITNAFKTIIDKMMSSLRTDKAFATKYEDSIRRGYAAMKNNVNWPEGYHFRAKFRTGLVNAEAMKKIVIDYKNSLQTLKSTESKVDMDEYSSDNGRRNDVEHLYAFTSNNLKVNDPSEFGDKFREFVFGTKKDSLKGVYTDSDIIEGLKKDNEIKAIKKTFADTKKFFDNAVKSIDAMGKEAEKAKSDFATPSSSVMVVANYYSARTKVLANACNIASAVIVDACKNERSQLRRLAAWCRSNDPKKGDKKDDKKTSTNESAFMSMRFI